MAALAVVRSGSVEERDPYWQIRAGIETLHGAPLTRPDSWSWAPVDAPFAQTSPGWNLILGAAYEVGRFAGFFAVCLIAIGSLLLLIVNVARRLGAGPLSTLAGVGVVLLLALPFLSPRATVAAQALFLGSLVAADSWRRRAAGKSVLLGVGAVSLGTATFAAVGSWLHLSWLMLSPAMAFACTVLWAATPALGRLRIAAFTAASVLGSGVGVLAGPYGTGAWTLSERVKEACSGLVTEWMGMFTPGLAGRWALPGVMAIAAATCGLVWVIKRWSTRGRDGRVGLVGALVVLAFPASLGGLVAVRFIGVAMLGLAPLASMAVAAVAGRARRRLAEQPRGIFKNQRVRFWADGRHWRPVVVALFVVLLPGTLLMAMPLGRPLEELALSRQLPPSCRLVSDPGSAATVILTRPDVKVWIDGRADYYGRERNQEAVTLLRSTDTSSSVLAQATCVILRRDGHFDVAPLVRALDADAGWTRLPSKSDLAAWVRS